MEKRILVKLGKGPRPVGKTNWTALRENINKPPIIDEESPEFVLRPGMIVGKPGQKRC